MAKVSPDQFKLFMTGPEWQGTVNHSFDRHTTDGSDEREPMNKLWARKETEARQPHDEWEHGSGVYDSMKRKGYRHHLADGPGDIPTIYAEGGRLTQGEGHHRIAAAAALERETGKPTYIPTNYERLGW